MTWEVFLALLAFAFVGSATPGPNTLMLLASGVNFGLARTVPHIAGIGLGFGTLLLATGFGLGQILEASPTLHLVLKIASALYLIWLAWKIGSARAIGSKQSTAQPLTVLQAAGFQWVNPKAWVVGVAAMAAYTDPANYQATALLVVAAFMLVLVPCALLWCGMGTSLRGFLAAPERLKWFNISMGVLLVASLWPMLR
jgi:threonine/homoserine/homoserine lactone efflux protein